MQKARSHLLYLGALAALALPGLGSAAPVSGQGTWADYEISVNVAP